MVELRDVHMQFEEKKVLDGVSLKVEPLERLVIMGQSGSGKSTILRLILGTLRPDAGSIFFKQFEITRLSPPQAPTGSAAHRHGLSVFSIAQFAQCAGQRCPAAGRADRQIARGD